MARYHKCLGEGCEKTITIQFSLCTNCEQKYGTKIDNWPPWLQFLYRDELRLRRQDNRIRKFEEEMDPDDIMEVGDAGRRIE